MQPQRRSTQMDADEASPNTIAIQGANAAAQANYHATVIDSNWKVKKSDVAIMGISKWR